MTDHKYDAIPGVRDTIECLEQEIVELRDAWAVEKTLSEMNYHRRKRLQMKLNEVVAVLKEMLPYFKMIEQDLDILCDCLAQQHQPLCIHNQTKTLLKKANRVLAKVEKLNG